MDSVSRGENTRSSSSGSLDHKPPTTRLVNFFVGAKKALSSTNNVYRANEIVSDAKKSIENIVSLDSRIKFVRKGINQSFTSLKLMRNGMKIAESNSEGEFKDVLKQLDAADARVKQAIHTLRTTQVERTLRPTDEKPKNLLDFVDEKGVDDLTAIFRECIDHTNEAQNDFGEHILAFDNEVQAIKEKLNSGTKIDLDYENPEIVTLFHSLESHATETACLLQCLVRHYDCCLSALKNTEGIDEAAVQLQERIPRGVPFTHGSVAMATPQPRGEEADAKMIRVLEQDAEEVQDVVNEIRDRVLEMETQLEQILNQENALKSEHDKAMGVIDLLCVSHRSQNRYMPATAMFIDRWEKIRQRIEEKLAEMNNLRDFFAGFLRAYDRLLVETARRRSIERDINKVAEEAKLKIEAILDEDIEERKAFEDENGEYLPSDIWPGLAQPPVKPEIRKGNNKGAEIPIIPPEILQIAKKRIRQQ